MGPILAVARALHGALPESLRPDDETREFIKAWVEDLDKRMEDMGKTLWAREKHD